VEVAALIGLGVARLEGGALVQRLAAIARRGGEGPLPDRARTICEIAQVSGLVTAVTREVFRQERIVRERRERRPEPPEHTLERRRWTLVETVLGPPHAWLGPHASYVDAAISTVMVLAMSRSGWASDPPMRAALAFRPFRLPAEAIRVPRTLGRISDTLAWIVHEDLPTTPSGEALSRWLRRRPRLRGAKP